MHDNDRRRHDGKDGTLHDDVQGKRVRKADVQHVRRHVRGMRDGVRKDGRQDGSVQAVRRRMQKVRTGMQEHDEVTSFFVYKNSDKNKFVTKKNQIFLFIFVLKMPLIFLFAF